MKWILVIYMTLASRPGLNPNVYLSNKVLASHRECVKTAKLYEDQGYLTYCQRGPLHWQTPAEYNAEHGIR